MRTPVVLVQPAALALLLCVLVGLVADATPAYAHGGQFGPPPNPQFKGPPGGSGGPPDHADPGFGGPIVTPGSSGGVTPRRASRRKTPITPTYETSWQLWWHLHRDAFLPARARGRLAVITPLPNGVHASAPTAWEGARRAAVETQALPFLLALLDPATRQPDDVRASACIALGKIGRDDAVANVLLKHLENPKAPEIVRESAALGLGFLRRTDPKLRLKTRSLDVIRARLLKVFDQYVGGVKSRVPVRTRAFAMFAIALLGDQPFQADPLIKDGRLLSKLLWERLGVPYPDRQLHIALLTALGRQPRAGIPDGIHAALKQIVAGKKTHGHSWDLLKRAHAVTAVGRLGGSRGQAFLLRLNMSAREPLLVRMAAELAITDRASQLAAAERSAALRVLARTFLQEQELLSVGLANIALGRLVGADLAAGSLRSLTTDKADALLLQRTEQAPWYMRGWAAIGLALAAREGDPTNEAVGAFRTKAAAAIQRLLVDAKTQASVRGAASVALGLLGMKRCVPALLAVARRSGENAEMRAHAALALGQIGDTTRGVVEALSDLAAGSGPDQVRGHAALALSLLGERSVSGRLIESLESDASTRRLSASARALGRLGDLGAVAPLIKLAGRSDAKPLVRAMAIVSLGRLLESEPRPSLLRLTLGSCYPARSHALQEAFTIL